MDKHILYMDKAIQLSIRARGHTSPNPIVGALIVKNNKIISRGFHRQAGKEHAEVIALKKARAEAKNATLYVTLEPCSSFGRTPPCTDAIIQSGIRHVVVGMRDPNPVHSGRGITILRKHHIRVECGVLSKQVRATIQPYIKYMTQQNPYVSVKVAQSIDGKIATRSRESQWITGSDSRRYAHRMRARHDAIMVGINTVMADNPRLDPVGAKKKFYKIIVDSSLRIKPTMRLFNAIRTYPVIIAASVQALMNNTKKSQALIRKGALLLGIQKKGALLDLKDLLKKLAFFEITSIFVEGGGRLIGSLLDDGLIDYMHFFIRPAIIGGCDALSSVQGRGINRLGQMKQMRDVQIRNINKDICIEGSLKRY